MTPHLGTTNLLIGILAAVSLLEVFAVVAVFLAAWLVGRRIVRAINRIGARHGAPATARVGAILEDVRAVTSTAKAQASQLGRLMGAAVAWLRR
jgi:hypothetical protein